MLEQTPSLLPASDEAFKRGQWRTAKLVFPFGRGINFEFAIADLEAVHTRIKHHNYPIRLDIQEKWHRVGDREAGVRQFLVQDPDGYLLRFQQDIGMRPA
jgi:CHASE3 domain sensor protein